MASAWRGTRTAVLYWLGAVRIRLTAPPNGGMTTTLIVLAHPEPLSFNGAWAAATRQACMTAGDTVLTSDLVEMAFDPDPGIDLTLVV